MYFKVRSLVSGFIPTTTSVTFIEVIDFYLGVENIKIVSSKGEQRLSR